MSGLTLFLFGILLGGIFGCLIGFLIFAILASRKKHYKKHGFHEHEYRKLKTDEEILSAVRRDHSAEEFSS